MTSTFQLLGPVHLGILAAIPGASGALTYLARGQYKRSRLIANTLATLLAANELIWYAWRLYREGFRFPDGLPLELCDLTLWLTVAACLTLKPAVFEFAWLAGISGSLMAVLTPDLWAVPLSYPTVYFFLSHGTVIVSLLFLSWSGLARPRPGCVWRAMGFLNAYACLIGGFDAVFHTNYMYLCNKPSSASLLDYFGRWPVYLAGGEAVAFVMFWLLWAPFRHRAPHPPSEYEASRPG